MTIWKKYRERESDKDEDKFKRKDRKISSDWRQEVQKIKVFYFKCLVIVYFIHFLSEQLPEKAVLGNWRKRSPIHWPHTLLAIGIGKNLCLQHTSTFDPILSRKLKIPTNLHSFSKWKKGSQWSSNTNFFWPSIIFLGIGIGTFRIRLKGTPPLLSATWFWKPIKLWFPWNQCKSKKRRK